MRCSQAPPPIISIELLLCGVAVGAHLTVEETEALRGIVLCLKQLAKLALEPESGWLLNLCSFHHSTLPSGTLVALSMAHNTTYSVSQGYLEPNLSL